MPGVYQTIVFSVARTNTRQVPAIKMYNQKSNSVMHGHLNAHLHPEQQSETIHTEESIVIQDPPIGEQGEQLPSRGR